MKLDELARSSVADLLEVSAPLAVDGLTDLRRRRRRNVLVRGVGVVTLLAVMVGGLALAAIDHGRQAQPTEREPRVTTGALIGIPAGRYPSAMRIAGDLHADAPLSEALPVAGFISAVEFSPDGTKLRYYDRDRRLIEVDLADGRRRTVWRCTDEPKAICGSASLSPDGRRVAHLKGVGVPRLEVIDLTTGDRHVSPTDWSGPAVWSRDGAILALATPEGVVVIETDDSTLSFRLLVPLDLHEQFVTPTWSPDGTRLAYAEPGPTPGEPGTTSFRLVVADVATGRTQAIHDLGSCLCVGLVGPQVEWSPDGKLIATTTLTGSSFENSGDVLVMRPDGSDVQRVGASHNFADLLWQPVP